VGGGRQGDPDELVAAGGRYAELFELQATRLPVRWAVAPAAGGAEPAAAGRSV